MTVNHTTERIVLASTVPLSLLLTMVLARFGLDVHEDAPLVLGLERVAALLAVLRNLEHLIVHLVRVHTVGNY